MRQSPKSSAVQLGATPTHRNQPKSHLYAVHRSSSCGTPLARAAARAQRGYQNPAGCGASRLSRQQRARNRQCTASRRRWRARGGVPCRSCASMSHLAPVRLTGRRGALTRTFCVVLQSTPSLVHRLNALAPPVAPPHANAHVRNNWRPPDQHAWMRVNAYCIAIELNTCVARRRGLRTWSR